VVLSQKLQSVSLGNYEELVEFACTSISEQPHWPFDDKFIRKPLNLNPTTLTNIVETKNYKTSGEYIKSRIIQASVFA
jgi:hypothetical protein